MNGLHPLTWLANHSRQLLPLGIWASGWGAMWLLDGTLGLGNLAMLMVLASTLASLWLGPWVACGGSALAALLFNLLFVPPRGTLAIHLHQDAMLLLTMLTTSWLVTWLMSRQRTLTALAQRHAHASEQLRQLGEAMRAAGSDPMAACAPLLAMLATETGQASQAACPVAVWLDGPQTATAPLTADEADGLRLCTQTAQALGPGTGRHTEQPACYLPLRGHRSCAGAALVRLPPAESGPPHAADWLAHAQALCDLAGQTLEQAREAEQAHAAREQAHAQQLRNTLLSAIAHDHRTPLASVLGAATALRDQDDRLSPAQRQALVATIVDETQALVRLTGHTLQLARLDSLRQPLHTDWESVEELVGSVLQRLRRRNPHHKVRARLDAGLPLLRCDAVLLVQLLDNLLDNALRHGGEPVEIRARADADSLRLCVLDSGSGMPGQVLPGTQSGLGLTLCQAIARVHGGQLTWRQRRQGGTSVECRLPLTAGPQPTTHEATTAPAERSTP